MFKTCNDCKASFECMFTYLSILYVFTHITSTIQLNFSLSRLNSPKRALTRTISRRVKVPELASGVYNNSHGRVPEGLLRRFVILKKRRNKF